jgi:hypothetical protein
MEEAHRRIQQCIQYGFTCLNLSNLDLEELPKNLPNNLN